MITKLPPAERNESKLSDSGYRSCAFTVVGAGRAKYATSLELACLARVKSVSTQLEARSRGWERLPKAEPPDHLRANHCERIGYSGEVIQVEEGDTSTAPMVLGPMVLVRHQWLVCHRDGARKIHAKAKKCCTS